LSSQKVDIFAEEDGYVREIDAQVIGQASQHAGAGRETLEDKIDPGAGVLLNKKVGRKVKCGELLATVYSSTTEKANQAAREVRQAFVIGKNRRSAPALIREIVE
jgi:pyrimidine-nucleoside phosphorylase